jgi:cytochrome c
MNPRSIGVTGALATSVLALVCVAAVPMPVASAALDGRALFQQRCQGCHVVKLGQPPIVAPNLAGVVGRKAAATGYSYSEALKASKLVWTRANLDKFLSGPQQMVPGSRMIIKVSDPAERAAIVDYLATTGH